MGVVCPVSATLESKKHSGIIDISSKNTLEIKDKLVSLPTMSIVTRSGLGNVSRNEDMVSKNTEKVLECGPLESVFPCSESKILDFLVTFQEYDYSISDISKNSGVGFKTTLGVIKDLETRQLIFKNRNVGRAKMFKLNLDSAETVIINKLALEIATKRAMNQAIT